MKGLEGIKSLSAQCKVTLCLGHLLLLLGLPCKTHCKSSCRGLPGTRKHCPQLEGQLNAEGSPSSMASRETASYTPKLKDWILLHFLLTSVSKWSTCSQKLFKHEACLQMFKLGYRVDPLHKWQVQVQNSCLCQNTAVLYKYRHGITLRKNTKNSSSLQLVFLSLLHQCKNLPKSALTVLCSVPVVVLRCPTEAPTRRLGQGLPPNTFQNMHFHKALYMPLL